MAPASLPEGPLPPSLRLLRTLVIILLFSMIAGVIAVVWVLVTRLPMALDQRSTISAPEIPAQLALPAGETPEAVTLGKSYSLVVTTSGKLLVFGTDGTLRQEIALPPLP